MLEFVLFDNARLRLFEERDVDELYALIDRNRGHLARWMPWAAGQTPAATLEFIRATRQQIADNNGMQTALTFDGAIVGSIGVDAISWLHESTSIAYWLAEAFQGRGLMTAAVRAYADHAFATWRLNRIELRAAVGNVKSCAIAERLGFQREGVLRRAEFVSGRVLDQAVYAMLATEWWGIGA
jgi:ribosomal-protein-serine acetyltransferase